MFLIIGGAHYGMTLSVPFGPRSPEWKLVKPEKLIFLFVYVSDSPVITVTLMLYVSKKLLMQKHIQCTSVVALKTQEQRNNFLQGAPSFSTLIFHDLCYFPLLSTPGKWSS